MRARGGRAGLLPPNIWGNPVLLEGGPQELCFLEESNIPVRPRVAGSVSAALVGARPQVDKEALPRGELACPPGGGHSVEPSVAPAGPRAWSERERLPGGGGGLTQVSKAKQDGEGAAEGSSWSRRMAWQLQEQTASARRWGGGRQPARKGRAGRPGGNPGGGGGGCDSAQEGPSPPSWGSSLSTQEVFRGQTPAGTSSPS